MLCFVKSKAILNKDDFIKENKKLSTHLTRRRRKEEEEKKKKEQNEKKKEEKEEEEDVCMFLCFSYLIEFRNSLRSIIKSFIFLSISFFNQPSRRVEKRLDIHSLAYNM